MMTAPQILKIFLFPALLLSAQNVVGAPRSDMEEIIVTVSAERREKDILKSPLSLNVLDGEQLRKAAVFDSLDLPQQVPGLMITTNAILGQPYIRGVGTDLLSGGSDPSVSLYQDGIYLTRPLNAITDLFDVKRVEVLKGPQGVLFGRNSTGGVLHIITKEPHGGNEVGANLYYGNHAHVRVDGVLNTPLSQSVSLRLALQVTDRGGLVTNLVDQSKLDDLNSSALRLKLKWTISDQSDLLIGTDYSRDTGTRHLAPKLVAPYDATPAVLFGGMVPPTVRDVMHDAPVASLISVWGINSRYRYLGDAVTFTSRSSWRESHFEGIFDLDGTQLPLGTNMPMEKSGSFSQELELKSAGDGDLEWLIGAFYGHENITQRLDLNTIDITSSPPAFLRDLATAKVTSSVYSLFGEIGYRLTSRLRLKAGLRYSHESKKNDFVETVNDFAIADYIVSDSWNSASPHVRAEYEMKEDIFLYASISNGFKSGGFNVNQAQMASFEPEKLWAYEAGLKASFMDGKGTVSAALFHYDYQNMQVNVLSPLALPGERFTIQNAAKSTLQGAEISLNITPAERLNIGVSLAYLDTKFDKFITINRNDPFGNPDKSGNPLPLAPEVTLNFAADYTIPVSDNAEVTISGQYHYRSSVYFDPFKDPGNQGGEIHLLNARLEYHDVDGNWYLALVGKNLTNRLYIANKGRLDGTLGNRVQYADPRSYGVQVGIKY